MSSRETEVLAANGAFYMAFARRDLAAMENVWSRHAEIACVHPGWDAIRGRNEVLESFRAILTSPNAPPIRATRATATIIGDVAFVICSESIDGAELIATNVFVREDGAYRLVLHQAGPIAKREPPKNQRKPPKVLN